MLRRCSACRLGPWRCSAAAAVVRLVGRRGRAVRSTGQSAATHYASAHSWPPGGCGPPACASPPCQSVHARAQAFVKSLLGFEPGTSPLQPGPPTTRPPDMRDSQYPRAAARTHMRTCVHSRAHLCAPSLCRLPGDAAGRRGFLSRAHLCRPSSEASHIYARIRRSTRACAGYVTPCESEHDLLHLARARTATCAL